MTWQVLQPSFARPRDCIRASFGQLLRPEFRSHAGRGGRVPCACAFQRRRK
jgi:hypothetical protein